MDLAPFVQDLRVGRLAAAPAPRWLWPDAGVELVFSTARLTLGTPGGGVWRPGPVFTPGIQRRPLLAQVGEGNVLRVRLSPWVPPALYADVLAGANAAPDVLERLRADDLAGAAEAVRAWVGRRLAALPGPLQAAARQVCEAPLTFHLPELEDLAGCSARELQRRSRRELGLTLKGLQRLARFQAAVTALASPPALPLAELALSLGYADQSHFTREVRAFSGFSPARLAERLRA